MNQVKLTQELIDEAREYSDKVNESPTLQNTPNYTGIQLKGRYYLGHLAQICFREYLKKRNKRYNKYDSSPDGKSDKYDVLVTTDNYRQATIDVKKSRWHGSTNEYGVPKWSLELQIIEKQYQRHKSDYYVLVKLPKNISDGQQAEVLGWTDGFTISELEPVKRKFGDKQVLCRALDANDLWPMSEFLDTLAS